MIERTYPYAPLVGDHPVAIALHSYRDTICVGLDIDPLTLDDLPQFRDALEQAYGEVLSVGRQADRSPRRRRTRRVRRAEPMQSKQAS